MVGSPAGMQARLVVLPPSQAVVSSVFQNVQTNSRRYDQLLAELQRFRGRIYLSDGAISPDELTADGRHKASMDEDSWHVLALDNLGRVCCSLRYLEEKDATRLEDLWIRNSALARCPAWGTKFRRAVELEIINAGLKRLGFGEVGGWAVAEDHRLTKEPLRIILATYSLLQLLGGCAGVATATLRHRSAMILQRIGLSPLVCDDMELPSYYDPRYRCQMQVLRFDSRFPNPKYLDWIQELGSYLTTTAPIICRSGIRFEMPARGQYSDSELIQART